MGLMKQVLVRKTVHVEFGELLDQDVPAYREEMRVGFGHERAYRDVNTLLIRDYLRERAIDQANGDYDNVPDSSVIDTLITWDTCGYNIELAWVGYTEVEKDD